ncbi:unnamed protein product, partial [Prorocentrum cordatum]
PEAPSPHTNSKEQDSSDSAEGSAEGGSQVGSSSRFSGHSSVTEVPRSDHTSTHSGTTTFTGESGKGAAGDGKDTSGGDNSGNSAEATTGASSRDVPAKSKHKKREAEQPGQLSVADGVSTLFISNIPTYFTQAVARRPHPVDAWRVRLLLLPLGAGGHEEPRLRDDQLHLRGRRRLLPAGLVQQGALPLGELGEEAADHEGVPAGPQG